MKVHFLVLFLTVLAGNFARAQTPTPTPIEDRMQELQRQMDILGQEVQKVKTGAASEPVADQSNYGFGPAASKVYRAQPGVSLGGYGEILYEHFSGGFNTDGTAIPTKRIAPGNPDFNAANGQGQVSIARAVLYAGYKFDDRWVMNAEFEWEGGGEEVNVEFLYFDYFFTKGLNFRAGKLLMPVGITNEMHEPTTFFSTHRPTLETIIIPSTWAEYGVGAFGDVGPLTYRSYLVTGLNASGMSPDNSIRESRHEAGTANANHFAWVTRADYTATPGLLAGASFYIGSATTAPVPGFDLINIPTKIMEVHAQYNWHAFDLRLMGAYSTFSNIDILNAQRPAGAGDSLGSKQGGFYGQLGYDLMNGSGTSLTPFVRYEFVDTQIEVPSGYIKTSTNMVRELVAGLSFKPISQLVFKADYQWYFLADGAGVNQANLAMGYVF